MPASRPRPTSRSSSPSTTRRGSCGARCWSWRRSCALRLELRAPAVRERIARPHGGDRQGDGGRPPAVRMLSVGEPNYGLAMKRGSSRRAARFVICDEIDLCDTEFYARAMALLERSDTDLVVGSKAMVGSNDQRPLFRRAATRVYNGLLRAVCHYPGTDTHGLKAFRREALLETARRCIAGPRRLRERVRHPRPPRGQEGRRDPVRRAREAPPVDPPGEARPPRPQERRQAGDLGAPHRRRRLAEGGWGGRVSRAARVPERRVQRG